MTEPLQQRNFQLLLHTFRGVLALAADEGDDFAERLRLSADIFPEVAAVVDACIASPLPSSSVEQREEAIASFRQAIELAPGKPWLWLQLGWTLFAYESAPRDLIAAREALDKALELAPNDPVLHLASAWLAQQEADDTGHFADLVEERVCDGLKRGIGWMIEGDCLDIDPDFEDLFLKHFPTAGARAAFRHALEVFDRFVPDELRFAFAFICSETLEYEVQEKWLREALCWETDDVTGLATVHCLLGRRSWSLLPEEERMEHFRLAGQLLLNRTGEDRRIASKYGHTNLCDIHWLFSAPLPEYNSEPEVLSQRLEFLPVGRDLYEQQLSAKAWRGLALRLAESCAAVGQWALEKGDVGVARDHLLAARRYERSAVTDAGPDLRRTLESCRDWRKALAEASRDLFLYDDNWEAAEKENERFLELAPRDQASLQWKMEFERTRQLSQQRRAEALELSKLNTQAQALLKLWGTALKKTAELREQMNDLGNLRLAESHEIDVLVNQLHEIVQNATHIQPAAWQRAQKRLRSDLGESGFAALTPNAQHFLTTAEVFYAASAGVPTLDMALIAVEYAKAVETQLRDGFWRPLGQDLESERQRIAIQIGDEVIKYREPNTLSARLSRLTLGESGMLLDHTLMGFANSGLRPVILRFFSSEAAARSFTNDLLTIAHAYRNGAAHAGSLDRPGIEALHSLLFEHGLLRRLAQLGPKADKA